MAAPVKIIRLLMSEAEFHNVMGRHVLAKHGVESWSNASVSALFMQDSQAVRLLQIRVEVSYSPSIEGNLA